MALSAERPTDQMGAGPISEVLPLAMKGCTKIWKGGLVGMNASGLLVPMSASTTLLAMGRADQSGDTLTTVVADGVKVLPVRQGTFKWANSSSTDAITVTEIGKAVYAVDDFTVAKTSGSSTRSKAGVCVGVDSDGVWVTTGAAITAAI